MAMNPTLAAAIRFIPLTISTVIVIGNLSPALPIWGFDYFILKLPHGSQSELISNLFILVIGLFPVIPSTSKARWYHHAYVAVALFSMAMMALNISLMWYFPWSGVEEQKEAMNSIFSSTLSQLLVCSLVMTYLVWSLSLGFLQRREIALVTIAIAISATVAGARVLDVTVAHERGGWGALVPDSR